MRKAINLLIISLFVVFISCQERQKSTKAVYENSDKLLEAVKKEIAEITVSDFKSVYDGQGFFVLIDVRETDEYDAGYIPGAISIPRGLLEFNIGKENVWEEQGLYIPVKTDSIILYCRTGNRSALAAKSLMELGYTNVKSLQGGWEAWHLAYPELKEPVIVKAVVPVEPVAVPAAPAKTKPVEKAPVKKEAAGGC